ncbi:amidase [Kitasatospora sp. NPDC056184]|uniref:amidase n=1 Tax=Kitasatospora sp. NPDC056184 TaxID=3345738 RepID=UPI0035DCE166
MLHSFELGLDDHHQPARSLVLTGVLPAGCVADEKGSRLVCEREGEHLLDAIGQVAREVRRSHGFVLNDVGVEKPHEWFCDGLNGYGAESVAQLLLLAVHRAELLGYTAADVVRFIHAVTDSSTHVTVDPGGAHQSRGLRS